MAEDFPSHVIHVDVQTANHSEHIKRRWESKRRAPAYSRTLNGATETACGIQLGRRIVTFC